MNILAITEELKNRVGIRQNFETKDYLAFDFDLVTSESGLVINSLAETFLNGFIVDQYLEFAEGFNVDEWSNSENYGQSGEKIVIINTDGKNQAFVSKANDTEDNINKDPLTEPGFWETFLSYRLKQLRASAIAELFGEIQVTKANETNTNVIKHYDRLFYAQTQATDMQVSTNFRCINVVAGDKNGITLNIPEVGLVVDTAQTIPFYLYYSDVINPIQTFNVTVNPGEENTFVWKELTDANGNPLRIETNGSLNAGGLYFVGFYEDDITGNIKSWQYNYFQWGAAYGLPVTGGGGLNYAAWRTFSPYYRFYPNSYEQTASKPQIPVLGQYWDQGKYDEELAFNIKIRIEEDHTGFILENKSRYDRLIQYKWAILILQTMGNTFRKNSDADQEAKINNILYGQNIGVDGSFEVVRTSGLVGEYDKLMKSIKDDLMSLTTNNFGLVQEL